MNMSASTSFIKELKDVFTVGKKEVLVFSAGLATAIVIGGVTKAYEAWKFKPLEPVINEMKFVKNRNKTCKSHIYKKHVCTSSARAGDVFECSYSILQWIVKFLDDTEETLDIAIYLITCTEFRAAVIRAHERGVKIRILSDFTMARGSGSAIPMFIENGIPVRMYDSKHMMHRKSAISDGKIVLMGSGNWTMQALAGNWDAWLKTNDPVIVKGYIEGFVLQWGDDDLMQPTFEEFQNMIVVR